MIWLNGSIQLGAAVLRRTFAKSTRAFCCGFLPLLWRWLLSIGNHLYFVLRCIMRCEDHVPEPRSFSGDHSTVECNYHTQLLKLVTVTNYLATCYLLLAHPNAYSRHLRLPAVSSHAGPPRKNEEGMQEAMKQNNTQCEPKSQAWQYGKVHFISTGVNEEVHHCFSIAAWHKKRNTAPNSI